MEAINKTTTRVQATTNETAEKATIGVIGAASLLIGLWALASFAAALVNVGPFELVKSYFTAVTGM